jgi:hypothetical protein
VVTVVTLVANFTTFTMDIIVTVVTVVTLVANFTTFTMDIIVTVVTVVTLVANFTTFTMDIIVTVVTTEWRFVAPMFHLVGWVERAGVCMCVCVCVYGGEGQLVNECPLESSPAEGE